MGKLPLVVIANNKNKVKLDECVLKQVFIYLKSPSPEGRYYVFSNFNVQIMFFSVRFFRKHDFQSLRRNGKYKIAELLSFIMLVVQ